MKFHDQTFEDVDINLDDNTFTGCSFERCNVIYRGGDFTELRVNNFNACNWTFSGAAGNTLNFLRALKQNNGGDGLVQAILTAAGIQ